MFQKVAIFAPMFQNSTFDPISLSVFAKGQFLTKLTLMWQVT
jgi:hypothetical protein